MSKQDQTSPPRAPGASSEDETDFASLLEEVDAEVAKQPPSTRIERPIPAARGQPAAAPRALELDAEPAVELSDVPTVKQHVDDVREFLDSTRRPTVTIDLRELAQTLRAPEPETAEPQGRTGPERPAAPLAMSEGATPALGVELGTLQHVPRIAIDAGLVGGLGLNARAAFLLSRVDGTMTYEEILDVAGMPRHEALGLLSVLLEKGAIR